MCLIPATVYRLVFGSVLRRTVRQAHRPHPVAEPVEANRQLPPRTTSPTPLAIWPPTTHCLPLVYGTLSC